MVLAAVIVIEVILTRGGSSPQAEKTTTPPSTGSHTAPSPTGTAPTTDKLPDNAESGLCGKTVKPEFIAVAIATVVSGVKKDTPSGYQSGVLGDCTSSAVRSRISELYGVQFGVDYSADLTGDDNAGPSAEYTVSNEAGTAKLELVLTKQQDGHYEVTDYTYGG